MTLEQIKAKITPVNQNIMEKILARTAEVAIPPRAMGNLHQISEKICAIQQTTTPKIDKKALFIMAGDHGVCQQGVAANHQSVTMLMLTMMLSGKSTACIFAKYSHCKTVVVDMGVIGDVVLPKAMNSEFYDRKIARGTQNFTKTRAMTREQAIKSIVDSYTLADVYIKENQINLISAGEMGIGNTTPSAAIGVLYSGVAAEQIVGRGAGVDNAGLARKINAVKKGIALHKPNPTDAIDVLSAIGGFEIGGMAGVYLAAAANGVPIVLDGIISAAAALIAKGISPAVTDYMLAGHLSNEQGHKPLLKVLGLSPILQLEMRLGEGSGALAAYPIIDLACKIITDVGTLKDAGIEL